jgi:hypothetical protein
MADGTAYRIYFRSPTRILGREDFEPPDDATALYIADVLGEACSDVCSSYELWKGSRRVDVVPNRPVHRPLISAAAVRERRQASVIERDDAIQRSDWAVARRRRLLARLDEWQIVGEHSTPSHESRSERLKRVGVSPRASRKPNLLDDWDVVRAAQHMIESYSDRAASVATERADNAGGLPHMKRWLAIAAAISKLQASKSRRDG